MDSSEEEIDARLAEMAADPAVQAELTKIQEEFACTEGDGLDEFEYGP